jgi:putative ABC transport system permease protein
VHIDWRVLLFATLLAMVTGTLFGIWPAYGTSKVDPAEAIKAGGRSVSGNVGNARRILIGAELALTVMLLVGSGLMLKSFYRMMRQDFGMVTDNAATLEMTFARRAGGQPFNAPRRMEIVRTVLETLRRDPAISAVGVVNDLPLRGPGGVGIRIQAIGMPEPKEEAYPRYLVADGGYFKAMGIPLLAGRTFDATDDSIGPRSAIISQRMATIFWPGVNPLGRTFYFGGDTASAYAVVGVVADVRESRLDGEVEPQMYFSAEENGLSSLGLVARSTLPPTQLLGKLRDAVRAASPTQAIYNLRMMDEALSKSVAPRRTNTLLIATFGLLALVLSAFGVYAVVSYSVTQRSREFGIRSALGADRSDIIGLVGREMTWVVGIGLVAGLAGAWGLGRVIASQLYAVETHDPVIYLVIPLLLLVPAALATLVPALRAVRVSPTEVMRAE